MLRTWVQVTKTRLNEIQSITTQTKESGLSTKTDNKKLTLQNAEKSKIAKNMYNCIADEPNIIINSSKTTKAETKNIRHF